MRIAVSCPNGHRLICEADLTGKSGKCPSCGVVFKIEPLPQAHQAPASAPTRGAAPVAPAKNPLVLDDGAAQRPGDKNSIVFLCPNGHRLRGPVELVGKPGTCPSCQVRFLVPDAEIDDSEALDIPDDVLPADSSVKGLARDSAIQLPPSSGAGSIDDGRSEPQGAQREAVMHPMAEIFRQLWPAKQGGATIEIHLENSLIVVPDEFSENASNGDLAVFSIRELDGSHTVAVVPWRSMIHVAARRMATLPEGMFDEEAP